MRMHPCMLLPCSPLHGAMIRAQAELASLGGALATRHEARDKAIVELTRLDEVQARALGQPGFQRHQVR